MEKFKVYFQIVGRDIDDEESTLDNVIEEIVESKDLDSLHTKLYEGMQNGTFKPEVETDVFGNDRISNVEYVLIFDSKGNEVYRDEDSFDYELWDYMEDFFNCRLTREE